MSRIRFHFSLRSLFLITTIVGLTVALWVQSRTNRSLREEVAPLRAKNRDLQNQLGQFPEVDPEQVQVMLVDSSLGWRRLRIHLPESRKYVLRTASGHIPVRELPSLEWFENAEINCGKGANRIDSGEFSLDIRVRKRNGEWILEATRLDESHDRYGRGLSRRHAEWLDDQRTWDVRSVGRNAEVIAPGEPIVLFSLYRGVLKEFERAYSKGPAHGIADGMILWIEEGEL
jgi:hypothetical protein